MMDWWNSLSPLNQWFYVAAIFFSVFFLWQLVAALMGLGGDTDGADGVADGPGADVDLDDVGHDVSHDFEHNAMEDAAHTVSAFKLLSVRSLISFATLFSWAGSLYLQGGTSIPLTLIYALLWGFAAMVAVSAVFALLSKMTETGNIRIASAAGAHGTVYLDIPASGEGEVRIAISGVVSVPKARSKDASPIAAGTPIRVVRALGPNTVEVEPINMKEEQS